MKNGKENAEKNIACARVKQKRQLTSDSEIETKDQQLKNGFEASILERKAWVQSSPRALWEVQEPCFLVCCAVDIYDIIDAAVLKGKWEIAHPRMECRGHFFLFR